jgi:phosphatidylglycerophosphate synthase
MMAQSSDMVAEDLSHEERLEKMRRVADYPLTIAVINPINRRLVRPLSQLGVSPNAVTVTSFVLSIIAAIAMWYAVRGDAGARLAAPLLVFASHLCDCLDGDLARYTQRFSTFGASLDPILDRVGEFAYVLAITWGLAGTVEGSEVWLPGLSCLGGVLIYYYITDAQVARVLNAAANDGRRYSLMIGSESKTRVKLGMYEPFIYGMAFAASAGYGLEGLYFFAVAFGLASMGQLVKLARL